MATLNAENRAKVTRLHVSKRKDYTVDEIATKTGLTAKQVTRAITDWEAKQAKLTASTAKTAKQQKNLVQSKYGFDYIQVLDRKAQVDRPSKVNIMRKIVAANPGLAKADVIKKVVAATKRSSEITSEWSELSLSSCYQFVKKEMEDGALVPK